MREYPQMKLRLNPELKELIEKLSKETGRSMNAEIVHRLEVSLTGDVAPNKLLMPDEAKAIAKLARDNLYNVLFNQCVIEINAAARSGSVMVFVDVADTVGENFYDDGSKICTEVVNPVIDKLKEIGYKVEVDGSGIVINF